MDPNAGQFPLFKQEVVGSLLVSTVTPHWRLALSNMKQGWAQSRRLGGPRGESYPGLGLSSGGTLSSALPRMLGFTGCMGGWGVGYMLSHTWGLFIITHGEGKVPEDITHEPPK